MEPFFANSGHKVESGSILPVLEAQVSHFQPATSQKNCVANSPDTQPMILALEAFLGRTLTNKMPFAYLSMSYDEIRQFTLLSDFANDGKTPPFIKWLMQNQLPVVHLVRKNPLNCFVEELVRDSRMMSENDVPILDVCGSVDTIRQMQKDVEEFRNWLVPTNRIEFYTETLFGTDQLPSDLVVHQLGKHLGLSAKALYPIAPFQAAVDSELVAAQLKSQLRPALLRAGYEHLYELPRAA